MKKKSFPTSSGRKSPKPKVTGAQFEHSCEVGRKLVQVLGFRSEEFDLFSKKQLLSIFLVDGAKPLIKAAPGSNVPRQYLRNFHRFLYAYMARTYFRDPAWKLTYMDMVVYGINFFFGFRLRYETGFFKGTPAEDFATRLYQHFENDWLADDGLNPMFNYLHALLNGYSQVNFRVYGYRFSWEPVPSQFCMKLMILITSRESERKYFEHKGTRRIAFKHITSDIGYQEESDVIIRNKELYPGREFPEETYEIYIQSHALHRFKERLDMTFPMLRNDILMTTMFIARKIVQTPTGPLFACCLGGVAVGYFTFFIHRNDLVVLTFLPLVSDRTPEGRRFRKIFNLSVEEIRYLGMDKTSFYQRVDFERVPLLKQALADAGMWPAVEAIRNFNGSSQDVLSNELWNISESHTRMVAQFFDKWQAAQAERTAYDAAIRAAEEEQAEEWRIPGAEVKDAYALDAALHNALREN